MEAHTALGARASTRYQVECVRFYHIYPRHVCRVCHTPRTCTRPHRRRVMWTEDIQNLTVTAGLNKLLDATLKTGLTTPLWYIGLKLSGTIAATDTMASHAGWAETTPYSDATRPAFTPGTIAAGSVNNGAAKAVFTINATATVAGCFMADNNTKGGTSGTLYGAGDFAVPRAVASGDTLNVQATASLTA